MKSVDVKHLIDAGVSVLHRNTIWHDFAVAIREGIASGSRTHRRPPDLSLFWCGIECAVEKKNHIFVKKCCLKRKNITHLSFNVSLSR